MIINFLIIIKQKMQSRKNWGLLVLLLILYMGIAVSLNIYYIKSNANTSQYIEIAAVPGSGEVTFRGMLIDSSWYNPQDVIVDSSTWAKNETGTLYTATDDSTLHLKIPGGEKFETTFNVGPEQGKVEVDARGKKIILDLRADAEIEMGKSFELPMLSGCGVSQYVINRNAAIVVGAVAIIMIFAIFLLHKERKSTKKENTQRNNAVELLRFAIIMCVCVHHYCGYAPGGYLGVDFFFVLGGFLLMQHFRYKNHSEQMPVTIAWSYTIGRYKRLLPAYLFAFLISILLGISLAETISGSVFVNNSIWELSMLEGFGITENLVVGPGWFCSSMLIAGFIIYFLLAKNEKIYLQLIAPVSFMVIFTWMFRTFGHLNRWLQYDSFIATGTLRGFAEMGLGCICFKIFTYLKERVTEKYKIWSSIIEICCIGYITYIIFNYGMTQADFTCVLAMAVLITSLFIGNSFLARMLNNKISGYLGKISLAIYLNHIVLAKVNWNLLLGIEWKYSFICYLLIVIVFSCISTEFVNSFLYMLKQRRERFC